MSQPTATPGIAPHPSGVTALNAVTGVAALVAGLTAAAGVAVGALSFEAGATPASGGVFALDGDDTAVLLQILTRNLAAALLLFSGFVTAGTTTVLGLLFVASWVGAGTSAVAAETGLDAVSPLVLLYLPLEFAGLLLAATAGLLPIAGLIRRFASTSSVPRVSTSRRALLLLAVAVAVIVLGACLETLVIHLQTLRETR
jgi:uncharacterized membrane protein SpoIIM required for sporulation